MGFRSWIRVGVTLGYHRDTQHARRLDAWGCQVLPKRRRASWQQLSQLGIGKHQLDAHSASSGGQQHEGSFPLTHLLSHSLSRSYHAYVLALIAIASRVGTPRAAQTIERRRLTDEATDDLLRTHTGDCHCYIFFLTTRIVITLGDASLGTPPSELCGESSI